MARAIFDELIFERKFIPVKCISPTNEEGVPIRKLFVSNLAKRTTIKDLQQLFTIYGKVDSCYIKRSINESHFGFVTFSDVESAVKAREAGQRMKIYLHCRILRVSPADSWHQPDSIENQRRFSVLKEINNDNANIIDDGNEPISNFNSPISVLNDDCLVEIFLYLPIADRIRMERVCKRWQALSQESWHAVKHLNLSKNTWGLSSKIRVQFVDTSTLRKVLIRCGQFLIRLDLSHLCHKLSSSTLTIVGKFCPNLQFINITALKLSPSGINSLMTNCQNINKFMMESLTGPCEKDLSQLFSVNKKLTHLSILHDSHVIGKSLGHLPLETMEEVHLKYCTSLMSHYLDSALDKIANLQSLTLRGCVCIQDSTLKAIISKESIKNLEFSGTHPLVSVNAITSIANLINLQRLCINESLAVTDDLLINISNNCKGLNYLDVSGCNTLSNRGISSLAALLKLETLNISFLTQVSDKALTDLASLKILRCWRCKKIKDPGVIRLISVATNLSLLDMSRSSITIKTLEVAATVTKRRTNNTILKIIVGGTDTHFPELIDISPFLQIVNVDLSPHNIDDDGGLCYNVIYSGNEILVDCF